MQYLSNNFAAVRAGASTSRGVFFFLFSGPRSKKQHQKIIHKYSGVYTWYMLHNMRCNVVLSFWGELYSDRLWELLCLSQSSPPCKANVCEHTGRVPGRFRSGRSFHRDICPEDIQIRQRNCLTTETVNSLSVAAGPGFIENRNPIASLASD